MVWARSPTSPQFSRSELAPGILRGRVSIRRTTSMWPKAGIKRSPLKLFDVRPIRPHPGRTRLWYRKPHNTHRISPDSRSKLQHLADPLKSKDIILRGLLAAVCREKATSACCRTSSSSSLILLSTPLQPMSARAFRACPPRPAPPSRPGHVRECNTCTAHVFCMYPLRRTVRNNLPSSPSRPSMRRRGGYLHVSSLLLPKRVV
ncbi:hypothetical protein EJ06DRAFT_213841 [Trichodelitschia bisporula]|uniref:Uncharacterized protein n=1 Tax=Trichodelitschia bisporula TaxID=703511 RepID=A0A6G1I943_9PEZI|nr:hypothetical protein EJ06DRAFT_213841 [Trichodelitschia bisporula]